jgi:2-keto-4-pentenoate hydratase/2-oxohepta-3-ene-1,7-dioic acid hydratase in catechol pathway
MKLIRYVSSNRREATLAITDGDSVWNTGSIADCQPDCPISLISKWDEARRSVDDLVAQKPDAKIADVELRKPVEHPEKIFCIGRNYTEHAREMGSSPDELPVVFNKFRSALIGPGETVRIPAISDQIDYEAELVVVIGTAGANISTGSAMRHVFGYMCGNDITARDLQKNSPGGQWLLGKSMDTFGPIGPAIVPAAGIKDPGNLDIQLRLNGEQMQCSNTSNLIFDIPFLVSHLSKFCKLQPGDLIFTGTPPGVGAARKPPVFLKSGDVLEVEIEHVGVLKNVVDK